MKCGTCLLAPVLAVLGLGALGFGGYNYVTTGCPMGSCESTTATVMQTAAGTVDSHSGGCCPLGAEVKTVKAEGDCATSCSDKSVMAVSSCSDKAASCSDKVASCSDKSEAMVTTVAANSTSECCKGEEFKASGKCCKDTGAGCEDKAACADKGCSDKTEANVTQTSAKTEGKTEGKSGCGEKSSCGEKTEGCSDKNTEAKADTEAKKTASSGK
jgi:hypothetical protein